MGRSEPCCVNMGADQARSAGFFTRLPLLSDLIMALGPLALQVGMSPGALLPSMADSTSPFSVQYHHAATGIAMILSFPASARCLPVSSCCPHFCGVVGIGVYRFFVLCHASCVWKCNAELSCCLGFVS